MLLLHPSLLARAIKWVESYRKYATKWPLSRLNPLLVSLGRRHAGRTRRTRSNSQAWGKAAMKPQLQETTARRLPQSHSTWGNLCLNIWASLTILEPKSSTNVIMPGTCPRRPAPFAILEALQHSTTVHDEGCVERLVEAYTTGSFGFVTSSRPRLQLQLSVQEISTGHHEWPVAPGLHLRSCTAWHHFPSGLLGRSTTHSVHRCLIQPRGPASHQTWSAHPLPSAGNHKR